MLVPFSFKEPKHLEDFILKEGTGKAGLEINDKQSNI
jgi:hypothetical protein